MHLKDLKENWNSGGNGQRQQGHSHFWQRAMSRRTYFKTAASGAVLALGSSLAVPPGKWGVPGLGTGVAHADDEKDETFMALPAPSPIPGGIDAPPVGFIHWFLPGPTDATTPFIGLRGMGLDVEPSTLTDYKGFTAYAILAGQAEGSDGKTFNVEFDVRVMEGEYVAEDGSRQRGVFGFF